MKNILVNLFAIILVGLTVQAQVSSDNSGETIEDTEHGYSFTAPADLNSEKSEGKCAGVIFSNSAGTINIVVKPHHSNSLANFFKNESKLSGQGFVQVGEVNELANDMKYVRAAKQMNGSNILLDVIFIPFSAQTGVVVMNFTPSESLADQAMNYSVNIVKSLSYSAPAASQSAGQSGSGAQSSSSSVLASKRLYAESGSSQTEIILCPSGGYSKNSNFFFSGGTSTDFEKGTWNVQNGYLVLNSNSGEQTSYQVSVQSNNSVSLNGRTYSMQNYGCR